MGNPYRIQPTSCDKAIGLLVVPNWPAQFWFQFLIDMLLKETRSYLSSVFPAVNGTPFRKHPFLLRLLRDMLNHLSLVILRPMVSQKCYYTLTIYIHKCF